MEWTWTWSRMKIAGDGPESPQGLSNESCGWEGTLPDLAFGPCCAQGVFIICVQC